MYLWEQDDWPTLSWDCETLSPLLAKVSRAQGHLLGRMEALGFDLRTEAHLRTLTEDVVQSSDIEGEKLDTEQVRSSIARRLGVDIGGGVAADRHVDGIVDMMLDATGNAAAPLSEDRLFGWHAALFPTGYSGLSKIKVGGWRDYLSAAECDAVEAMVQARPGQLFGYKTNTIGDSSDTGAAISSG